MVEEDRNKLRLEDPTILGKMVGIGGALFKLLGTGVDTVLNRVADIVVDAEQSFRDGLDPNIEDANIIEEHERPSRKKKPN